MQEEEKGIEMSADFEGKVQDIEKKEDEEGNSDEEDDDEEPDKEMGETDAGAERLDQQVSALFDSRWYFIWWNIVNFNGLCRLVHSPISVVSVAQ